MNILTEDVQKDNYDVSNLDSNMLIRENKGKIQERIEQFNIKYVNAIRRLKDSNPDYDLDYYEYKVAELSFKVDKLLVIKSHNVLRQVLASISMSDLLLDEGIENNDLECLMTAFSTLRYDLDNLNIFKEWFNLNINFKSNPGIIKSKEDMFNDTYS